MAPLNIQQTLLFLLLSFFAISGYAENINKRDVEDQKSAETHHHHHHGGGGGGGGGVGGGVGGRDHSKGAKYFMYAHQPDKKSYEFGYKRGNDHHAIERYEKAGPKHNFKTKVRWHDAHGGHGEQYWDYNHAPKHHEGHHQEHHGSFSSQNHASDHGHHETYGHGQGHYSEPVPSIVEAASSDSIRQSPDEIYKQSKLYKRSGYNKKPSDIFKKKSKAKAYPRGEDSRENDATEAPSAFPSVLGFDPYTPPKIADKLASPSFVNREDEYPPLPSQTKNNQFGRRGSSRSSYQSKKKNAPPKLAYDLDTGRVYDENTGKWFKLVQV